MPVCRVARSLHTLLPPSCVLHSNCCFRATRRENSADARRETDQAKDASFSFTTTQAAIVKIKADVRVSRGEKGGGGGSQVPTFIALAVSAFQPPQHRITDTTRNMYMYMYMYISYKRGCQVSRAEGLATRTLAYAPSRCVYHECRYRNRCRFRKLRDITLTIVNLITI